MSSASWSERLFGGLKRTSEKLGENLAGLTGKARLDEDDLDRIEEALITADLGPAMAGRIRERLAARRDAVASGTEELRKIVAEESRRCCARSPNRWRSTPFRARRSFW